MQEGQQFNYDRVSRALNRKPFAPLPDDMGQEDKALCLRLQNDILRMDNDALSGFLARCGLSEK